MMPDILHINSDFSPRPSVSFEEWKQASVPSNGSFVQWAVFRTPNDALVLAVSKLKKKTGVAVDFRLWNTTGSEFTTVISENIQFKDIVNATYEEFLKYCESATQDMFDYLQKPKKETLEL